MGKRVNARDKTSSASMKSKSSEKVHMSAKPPAIPTSQFAQLIALAISGSAFAQEQIFYLCRPVMLRGIDSILRGTRSEEKTDILHDAYINLICALGRIKDPTNLVGFARGVAQITAKQYLDKNSSTRMIPMNLQGDDGEPQLPVDAQLHPFEDIDFKLSGQQVIRNAWPRFSPPQKQVFELKCVDGLDPEAIALVMKIERNQVDQHTFQLKQILLDFVKRK